MAASSLPPLHAQITANAQGLVSELNRADNVTRRKTAAMRRDFDRLRKDIAKPFTMGRIGTSIMTGAGIGSGFHIAQKASGLIAGHWERAAESAKSIEEFTARSLKATEAMMRLRRNDVQELAKLEAEEASLQRQSDEAKAPKTRNSARRVGGEYKRVERPMTDAESKLSAELSAKLEEKALEVEQQRRVVENAATAEAAKNAAAETKAAQDLLQWKEQGIAQAQAYTDKLMTQGETVRKSVLTPMEEYGETVAELGRLYAAGAIDVDTFGRAVAAANAKVDEAVDKDLADFFGDLDAQSAKNFEDMAAHGAAFQTQMNQMWENVGDRAAQNFADMVLTGEASFGQLADIVARSMLEIVARMAIINPLMNMMFAGVGGFTALPTFFSGGKADGGPVSGGALHLVGERGPELFKAPTSGSIIPAGKTASLTSGKGGDTYYIDATGADAAKIAQLEAALRAVNSTIERRAVAAVGEAASRRRR